MQPDTKRPGGESAGPAVRTSRGDHLERYDNTPPAGAEQGVPEVVAVDAIDVSGRLRSLDEAQVAALMASILDVGLLNPITVDAEVVDGACRYSLIAGAHRLEACRRLGVKKIVAQVVTMGDLEKQIAECDENLVGPKLTPAETALFTAKRKEAYEALHPETKARAPKGNQYASRQVGDKQPADRFTADTASKTGKSERAVQRDAERGEKVIPEVLSLVKGTTLDSGTYLDKIKRLPPNEQVAAAKRDLAWRKRGGSVVKEADYAAQTSRLLAAWDAASPKARADFLKITKLTAAADASNAYTIASGRSA